MFEIYKIEVQCRKNSKHPCEFVLTRAVKLIHVIFLRLYNLEYCEKTYHQFYFYQSTTLWYGNRSYGKAGENKVFQSHSGRTFGLEVVRPLCHDGPYIRSWCHTFALRVFRENIIFSPLFAYSPTLKANKGFLGSPNTDYM